MKTIRILILTFAIVANGCATSTAGLTKDQLSKREDRRAAWSSFGLNAAGIGLQLGLTVANASRGDQQLPSGKGFRK